MLLQPDTCSNGNKPFLDKMPLDAVLDAVNLANEMKQDNAPRL